MLILLSNGAESEYGFQGLKRALKDFDLSGKNLLIIGTESPNILNALTQNFSRLGFHPKNIYIDADMDSEIDVDFMYVSAGNAFQVVKLVRKFGFQKIKNMLEKGTVYIGASAGAVIAGKDLYIATLFDRYTEDDLVDLSALCLFDGTVIPHHSEKQTAPYRKEYGDRYNKIYAIPNKKYIIIKCRWE